MIDAGRLRTHVDGTIRALRHRWEQTYGWTHLMVRPEVDLDNRVVTLRGTIVNAPLRRRLAAAVQPELPIGFSLRLDLQPLAGRGWYGLQQTKTAVYREHPRVGRRALATELLAHDGPVELIHREDGDGRSDALVRARDGTMGWMGQLGPLTEPVAFAPPRAWSANAFTFAARAFMGAPYRLGGTTRAGIDCSGLVQRAFGVSLGGMLPRHSVDQLAIAPEQGMGSADPGDLVFVWGGPEARCHVVVVTSEAHCTHASRTRGLVLEEPITELLERSERVMHVRFRDLATFQLRILGANSIAERFELGAWQAPF